MADPVVGVANDKPLFKQAMLENYKLVDTKNYDGILWLNYKVSR